ncbi:chemotaxis protein CheB [Fibrella aquatica]|uniref:chemotaxis protein CheB n=1 Tax=Fibrella aquatica TaxID=3242487 RepID=UPI003522D718
MAKQTRTVVVIGGSTGSLDVLLPVLSALQSPLTLSLVVVVHRKNTSNSPLAALLATKTSLPVHEVDDKDLLKPGHIYLAPADYHLLFEKNGTFSLDDSEKVHFSRPSIDVTFESAADVYGAGVVGILLSGANADGTRGLQAIKQAGGISVAQQPTSAQVAYMPQQAIDNAAVDRVLDVLELIEFINLQNQAL